MKIDYDVGDLVVAVKGTFGEELGLPASGRIKLGSVYTAIEFVESRTHPGLLGVRLAEVDHRPMLGFLAVAFRKLPKKSQEFFTGERRQVPA